MVSAPCLIEQTLCQPSTDDGSPQLAKDFDYASSVLEAWKRDEDEAGSDIWEAECRQIAYKDDDGVPLYGHLVRKPTTKTSSSSSTLPGILLLHTAAGPHDLFLLWKAACLVNSNDAFPNGCVVLIADLLSDETGWGWDPDRSKYNEARDYLMQVDEAGVSRPILRQRLTAAINTLTNVDGVDPNRLAALGWCFGGHAVLELGRMNNVKGLKAMSTFHGVFDVLSSSAGDTAVEEEPDTEQQCEILICHGVDDPFVSDESLDAALETFHSHRHTATLLKLEGVKHGFSNPAQEFNTNPAFGFDEKAASESWHQTLELLKRRLNW